MSNLFNYKTYTYYNALVVFREVVTKVKIGQYGPGSRFSKAEIDFESMALRLYIHDPEDPKCETIMSVHDLILQIDD